MLIQELLEAALNSAKSLNKSNGYHGQWDTEIEGAKRYSAMHSFAKKALGSAMQLTDVKTPNVMVRDFLDSTHGRHLADSEKRSTDKGELSKELVKSFKSFKQKYKPEQF